MFFVVVFFAFSFFSPSLNGKEESNSCASDAIAGKKKLVLIGCENRHVSLGC